MDHRGKAFVGLVITGCDSPELFQIAEEILNHVVLLIHNGIAADLVRAAGLWRNDRQSAALIEVQSQGITVEGFVGEEGGEIDALQDRLHAYTVMALAGP